MIASSEDCATKRQGQEGIRSPKTNAPQAAIAVRCQRPSGDEPWEVGGHEQSGRSCGMNRMLL
jgi:hypothetical protein